MNREGIIIIVCIGIVVLFYFFADKAVQVEDVGLVKRPAPTSTQDAVNPVNLTGGQPGRAVLDSLENK